MKNYNIHKIASIFLILLLCVYWFFPNLSDWGVRTIGILMLLTLPVLIYGNIKKVQKRDKNVEKKY